MRPSKASGTEASGVFYGWWIVAASFVIAMYVAGVIFYGFTAIFEPIADELGWSYAQISAAASLRGLEMGLLAPVVGMFVDRFGPRRLIAGGALLTAVGLFMLSQTHSLTMFYGAFVFMALGMSCCTQPVLMTAISNWFESRVGLACGIAVSGFGFGGLLVPAIVRMIEAYDWRLSILYLAIGTLVLLLPLSLLFRHKPEHYGMLLDGERGGTDNDKQDTVTAVKSELSTRKALASRTFWHIVLASTCYVMVVMAVVTHIMPYLSSVGIGKSQSAIIASAIPVISVIGRAAFGWLGDRHGRIRVTAIVCGMMSVGAVLLGVTSNSASWLLLPFLLLFGIGYGGFNPLRVSLVREFFGRSSFGAVFGLVMGMSYVGSLVGPPLAGWVFDEFGSYKSIWFAFGAIMLVAVFLVTAIDRYGRNDSADTPSNR